MSTLGGVRSWFQRLLCKLDEHKAPEWWSPGHGRWAECRRCGERFDAAEQDRANAEMQNLSL